MEGWQSTTSRACILTRMRKLALVLLLCAATARAQVTVIKAGTLIDGTSSAPRANQTIVIRGNRIESVGANAAVPGREST